MSCEAFADEAAPGSASAEGAPVDEATPEEKPQKHEQLNEDKPLVSDAAQNPKTSGEAPGEEGERHSAPASENKPASDEDAPAAPTAPTVVDPNRVGVDVPLTKGEGVVATAGTVIVDGLNYVVNPDGGTATVAGSVDGAAPKGDVIVAATVFSGSDEYQVTAVADEAFKECDEIESIVLPDSLETLGKDAFKGCTSLLRIEIGERSKLFASYDGMLFDKGLAAMLVCPEGKRSVVSLPDSMTTFADGAFAGCRNLEAFQVGEGNQAFASVDGVLYSADRTRLLMAPARIVSVIVAPDTKVIAAGAFSACSGLASVIANGFVETIEGEAFTLEALSTAMVALASGDDYDARKAVWGEAGFSNFIEPAAPGEIQQPEPARSGFVYELLDDYTLAVSWMGEADPEADLVIPTTAKLNDVEYRVSAIAAGGFQGRQSLSSVQIRAPISVIGDDAFAGCTGLVSVEFPEGVTAIGAGAFSSTAVQRAVIPASVSSVGARAFADCANLSQIITFSNAASVAGDAIAGCSGVSIYAPYSEASEYPWYVGLVASGNSIQPYGLTLPTDPLVIPKDRSAYLFEDQLGEGCDGVCEAPEGCVLSFSYLASCLSVDIDGTVSGKADGSSEVVVTLELDGMVLDRAFRLVEVKDISSWALMGDNIEYSPITVTFDPRNGTPAPVKQVKNGAEGFYGEGEFFVRGDCLEEPVAMVRPGFKFCGWGFGYKDYYGNEVIWDFANSSRNWNGMCLTSQMANIQYPSGPLTATANISLYAIWEAVVPSDALDSGEIGPAGDTVTWYITSANELVITPTNGESGTLPNVSFPWQGNATITKATIESGVKAGTSLASLFYNCSNLASIDGLQHLNTSSATTMNSMFYGCSALASLDVSGFDTKSVQDMGGMFRDCKALEAIAGVDGLATANVTNMGSMFYNCSALQSLDLSSYDTKSATSMNSMFYGCSALASLDVSGFDTSSVQDMGGMFRDCEALEAIAGVGGFATSNVESMGSMFYNCSALKSLDLSSYDTKSATSMNSMFYGCSALTSLDVSGFDTKSATNMNSMFRDCSALASLDVSGFDTSSVKDMSGMFRGCEALEAIAGVGGFATANVESMNSMFFGCSALQSLDVSGFDTKSATTMDSMFYNCSALQSLDVSGFDTSTVQDMGGMFKDCSSLAALDVSRFNTSKTMGMDGMFSGCSALASLDVSGFDTKSATNMNSMFRDCGALASLDVSGFDTKSVREMTSMFDGCSALQSLDLSSFDTKSATSMTGMFSGCSAFASLDVSGFDTSSVQHMAGMFDGCSALQSLDLSSFDTSSVTNSLSMFFGCSNLTEIKVGDKYSLGFLAHPSPGYSNNWINSSGVSFAYNAIPVGVADTYKAELATYTIIYMLDGGTQAADAPASFTVKSSDVTLPTPTKVGYSFGGWYDNEALTGAAIASIPSGSTGNKTFYAKWTPILFSFTLGSATGVDTAGSTQSGDVAFGSLVTLKAAAQPGYRFSKWTSSNPLLEEHKLTPEATFVMPAGQLTMTPSAEPIEYAIAYELNDGVQQDGAATRYTVETAVTLPTPTRAGFDFVGWYDNEALTGTAVATISVGSMGDRTFYAQWKRSVPADCQVSGETGGVTWYITAEGELVLTPTNGFEGEMEDITADKPAPWNDRRASILSLAVEPGVKAGPHLSGAFSDCVNMTSVNLSGLDTSNTTSMSFLFSSCEKLPSIDLSVLDTSNVKDMYALLSHCESLVAVDLSALNTSNVVYAHRMFNECRSLTTLDLSGFATSKLADADHMFYNCMSLESLNLSDWDTSNTADMCNMFEGCSNFAEISVPDGFVSASAGASRLFFDCPKLTTIPANLSLPESVSAEQAFGFSQAPAEFVATTYAGSDPQLLAYDWISDYRLLNGIKAHDTLQTTDGQNRAWWTLDTNGTLTIGCEEGAVIADLGWVEMGKVIETAPTEGAWSPLRSFVVKVVMEAGVAAENTGAWFSYMDNLTDIDQAYIPVGAQFAESMFKGCPRLTGLPSGFSFPDSVVSARAIFRDCGGITSLPDGFTLQNTKLKNLHSMFGATGLEYLPDTFAFPETAVNLRHVFAATSITQLPQGFRLPDGPDLAIDWLFGRCSKLEALPRGFTISDNVVTAQEVFTGCSSLKALPDGFSIPDGLDVKQLFYGCSQLTSLPASLKLNGIAENQLNYVLRVSNLLPTYYAGDPADVPAPDYWETVWHRKLITSGNLPADTYSVDFKLPDASGAYTEASWLTRMTEADGMLKEMSAPAREHYAFVGWFVDDACTIPFDFAKSVAAQAEGAPSPVGTLYACYAESSKPLPTVDGGQHASWELAQDGTLRISCEDGYTIADLGWDAANLQNNHWGPLRSKVKRVQMDASVKAVSMACWFRDMENLTDVSGVFVPEGVTSVSNLFSRCSSLAALPDGFTVPEGVKALDGMVSVCPQLTSLPAGFTLPDSAEVLASMFELCGIRSLPEGFTITKNVTDTRWMFQSCKQLTELPEGFALPLDGKLNTAKNMFNMAGGLRSIPVGFKIPATVTDCSSMFGSCVSLTTIPEGFSLPAKGDLVADHMFESCNTLTVLPASLSLKGLVDAGWNPDTLGKEMFMVYPNQVSSILDTLYVGSAGDMPDAAWWTAQRRTLHFANDPDKPLPSGMRTVQFKTASIANPGQWDIYATVLTDESGNLVQPGNPQPFGYPFKGWFADEACTTKFDFDTQVVTEDGVVVYGAFGAPILRGTVPLAANVVVDTSGGTTAASAEIRSFTPVDTVLTSVACEVGPGVAELLPDEGDRTKPIVEVRFPDRTSLEAPFTGEPTTASVPIPLSTGFASPGTLSCDIGLDLNGAKVLHRIEDHAADVAGIVWTVEIKK